MGSGSYDTSRRSVRSAAMGYDSKPAREIFKQRSINNAMNPYGITVRESCDSEEHPESIAIVIGLDETGSMGMVPHSLVKEGLPHLMDTIIQKGVPDPQVLFLGIGDHECDRAPLQVGQFESSDELLDKWLTDVYLEGCGGGNAGESYHLAWYLAANHTKIDCFEKRKQKGFLFTIGDEPVLPDLPASAIKRLMGPGQYSDMSAVGLLNKAREKYNVFHVHIKETPSGGRQDRVDKWHQLIQDNLLVVEHHEQVADVIASTIIKYTTTGVAENQSSATVKVAAPVDPVKKDEMIL